MLDYDPIRGQNIRPLGIKIRSLYRFLCASIKEIEKTGSLASKPGSLAFAIFAILPLLKKEGSEWMLNSEPGRVLAKGCRWTNPRLAAPNRFVFP